MILPNLLSGDNDDDDFDQDEKADFVKQVRKLSKDSDVDFGTEFDVTDEGGWPTFVGEAIMQFSDDLPIGLQEALQKKIFVR